MSIDLGPIQFDDHVVLLQLQRDLKDDWFPDPRRYEDMFKNGLIQQHVLENFKQNHGTYRPAKRTVLNVPKTNFTLRYGMETSVSDRALYHALTSYLVPFYDPLIPWNVFNHRHNANEGSKKYLFRRAVPAWQDFVGVVRVAIKTSPVLLSTDLTNYFENIDIGKLKKAMMDLLPEIKATAVQKGHIRAHLDTLFECLREWCFTETSGLPQNRDASSFLANIYMLTIDRTMLGCDYQYFRYMDDIKIACADIYQARLALKQLGLALRELGLSVNSGKTQICMAGEKEAIERCLETGGGELRQIDAIWRTRSIKPISRSFPTLQALTLRLLREGQVSSREFRYCVGKLETLATCQEFSVPNEYFELITPLAIDALTAFPAATDQLAQYLRAVPTTAHQLDLVARLLQDKQKNFYTWQNYRLWTLLVQKQYRNDALLAHALDIVSTTDDNATRCGATLYVGALGEKKDRIVVAKNFASLISFLGQRSALLAVQELHYNPYLRDLVQPTLRKDLYKVYLELKREGIYVAPPELKSITSIIDNERDYD